MHKKHMYYLLPILMVFIFGLRGLTHDPESDQIKRWNNGKILRNPDATVEMSNTMKFTPDTVQIKKGETVKWGNTSLIVHSVTGDPSQATIQGSAKLPDNAQPFDSGMMDPKQSFTHTFKVPGTYQYFCIPHEGVKMYGWIIVEG